MAIMYNSQNVDEKYSPILEPNLYYGSIFIPGITCTDRYETGPAGAIMVHKLSTSACEVGKPGRDFTDEETKDTLIPILMNNNYLKSKKIYGVQASAVSFPLANENLSIAVQETGEGNQYGGLACLVQESKAATDTTEADAANVKHIILEARKQFAKGKGKADVMLCSPDFYTTVLEAAGDKMTPVMNDRINATGNVGQWLGFLFVEAPHLSAASAKYYDHTGTLKTVALDKVDFVMYNHNALSIIPNFETARLVDSEDFNGCKAQVELNAGYRVTNSDLALVHKHAAAAG